MSSSSQLDHQRESSSYKKGVLSSCVLVPVAQENHLVRKPLPVEGVLVPDSRGQSAEHTDNHNSHLLSKRSLNTYYVPVSVFNTIDTGGPRHSWPSTYRADMLNAEEAINKETGNLNFYRERRCTHVHMHTHPSWEDPTQPHADTPSSLPLGASGTDPFPFPGCPRIPQLNHPLQHPFIFPSNPQF